MKFLIYFLASVDLALALSVRAWQRWRSVKSRHTADVT